MYTPTFDRFKTLAETSNTIPVFREISADLETPVSAYLKVARGPYSFLLESVEGGENLARYSFIGTEPLEVLRTGPGESGGEVDPLDLLKARMESVQYARMAGLPRFSGGAVGYVSYDAIKYFEPRVPQAPGSGVDVPESVFMLADGLLIFDHVQHKISVVAHAFVNGDVESAYRTTIEKVETLVNRLQGPLPRNSQRRMSAPNFGMRSAEGGADYASPNEPTGSGEPVLPARNGRGYEAESNMSRDNYAHMIEVGKKNIYDGEVIQVVLSHRMSRRTDVRPFDLYRSLRAVNPSPYMFYIDMDGFQLVGASPEMLVQVIDGEMALHPIAGTRPRGRTPEEDLALEQELRTDEKERAEHVMLLDLGRNDVGRVSKPGTVKVLQQMDVERYSHVMHLVSHVTGTLRDGMDAYDALRAGFPAGTVSGAPKVRAMELIAELEPDRRGGYAGAAGYFSYDGNMDTAISLRTIVFKDGVAHVQAGGGVVADSTADGEYQETINKMAAMMRAIDHAEENMSED
ncbi:MAG: anthranilate synthase component I [Chloroflexi bacterium]|nr:anthranilate synthase component I [Chloroflexota bacterium]